MNVDTDQQRERVRQAANERIRAACETQRFEVTMREVVTTTYYIKSDSPDNAVEEARNGSAYDTERTVESAELIDITEV